MTDRLLGRPHSEAAAKFRWALPQQRRRALWHESGGMKTQADVRRGRSFICLLTSSLVYLRRLYRSAGAKWGPSAAEPSVISHFWCAAGDQREWERARATADWGEGGGSRTEGICWIISLQCCSIDLGTDPCRHGGRWRLAHVNAEEL